MGGEQISAALAATGVDSATIYARDLAAVRNSVLVFIKTSRIDHLLLARARGNRLVLDVQDTPCFKRRIKNRGLFHGLLFKNARQLADFGRRGARNRVIYHQWDPRYAPHTAGETELRVGYIGLARSLELWASIPGVQFVDHLEVSDFFSAARAFNCHLSLRSSRRDQLYKPNAKISTAAACNAVLITNRDQSAIELLGEDYPYYTAGVALADVNATLELARRTIGGPLWRQALTRLGEVRERTRIERIATDYIDLLAAV